MSDALQRLLARSSRPETERVDRAGELVEIVRDALDLDASVAVTVQQLSCAEPGCPPIETKIVTLGPTGGRRWTLHVPIAEVTDTAVRDILHRLPQGENA